MAKTSGGTRSGGIQKKSAPSIQEVNRIFEGGLRLYEKMTTAIININNGDRDPSQKTIVKDLIPRMEGMYKWAKSVGEGQRFLDATASIVRKRSRNLPDNMIAADQVRDIVLGKAKEYTNLRLKNLMK